MYNTPLLLPFVYTYSVLVLWGVHVVCSCCVYAVYSEIVIKEIGKNENNISDSFSIFPIQSPPLPYFVCISSEKFNNCFDCFVCACVILTRDKFLVPTPLQKLQSICVKLVRFEKDDTYRKYNNEMMDRYIVFVD